MYKVSYKGMQLVREDLYDGTDDKVLSQKAEFSTKEEAQTFIETMVSMCCGVSIKDFSIESNR